MNSNLKDRHATVVTFSDYPSDYRVRRETEALLKTGLQVDLICILKDRTEAPRENVNGVSVRRLSIEHLRGGKLNYILTYGRFLICAAFIMAFRSLKKRYSLVHVHNMPDFLVACSVVPRLRGAKVLLDLHDPMPELYEGMYGADSGSCMMRVLRQQEQWSLRYADLALTPNIAFRDIFLSRGCPPEKMEIVMNSPDANVFSPPAGAATSRADKGEGRPFRVVHHGSILERHGLHTAVRALAALVPKVPNIQFEIYGRATPYLQEVLTLARELNVADRVKYEGEKNVEELATMISEIDLGLVPNQRNSFTEINMPTRIFEYLAMGKPVISPDTSGIRDYFNHGNMLFFMPGDATSLAEKILWVYQHPAETAALVTEGCKVYREHSWEEEEARFVRRVAALLQREG